MPHDHHHHERCASAESGYPEHPESGARGSPSDGHDKHAGHSVGMFRSRFWISLALTIPTVIWGHMLMRLTGDMPPALPGSQWIAPVFGTVVFFYGGWVFVQGSRHSAVGGARDAGNGAGACGRVEAQ